MLLTVSATSGDLGVADEFEGKLQTKFHP